MAISLRQVRLQDVTVIGNDLRLLIAVFALLTALVGCAEPAPGAPDAVEESTHEADLRSDSITFSALDSQPRWAIPYGAEFWSAAPAPGEIDVGRVIERVSNAFAEQADGGGAETFNGRIGVALTPGGIAMRGPNDWGTLGAARTVGVEGVGPLGHAESAGYWSVRGNTAQRTLGSGVVEHIEVRDDGVQFSWVLNTRPRGDVRVELELDDWTSVGGDALVFEHASAEAHLQVTDAVVVDQSGDRWQVPTTGDGSRVVVDVPAELLAGAVFPVAIDPVLQPEFELDDPFFEAANSDQITPAVASSGGRTLVVWQTDAFTDQIVGTRVADDGSLIDPGGLTMGVGTTPAVAARGDDYLVAYRGRNGSIVGYVVPAAGDVPGPAFTMASDDGDESMPAVATNGTDYLIAWQDDRSGNPDILARVVGPDRTLGAEIVVSKAAGAQRDPALATDGRDYLTVWTDERNGGANPDIYGAGVSRAGVVRDTAGIIVEGDPSPQTRPDVSFDGTIHLVAWTDDRNAGTSGSDIWSATVAVDGTVGTAFQVTDGSGRQDAVALAAGASSTLFAWEDERTSADVPDIYGARVVSDGTVVDGRPFVIHDGTAAVRVPDVGYDGTNWLVAWQDERSGGLQGIDIYATQVGSTSAPDTPFLISRQLANTQMNPVVASNGTRYLVAWEDRRNLRTSARLTRVDPDGTIVDAAGIVLSDSASGSISSLALASNGANYLLAWRQSGALVGGRLEDATGTAPDFASPLVFSSAANGPGPARIASDGEDYVVAWHDGRDDTNFGEDVFVAHVDANTGVVGSDNRLSANPGDDLEPRIAGHASGYAVAWTVPDGDGGTDILVQRVNSDATTNGVTLPVVAGPAASDEPAIAIADGDYLIAWTEQQSFSSYDLRATRMATDGTFLDGADPATRGFDVANARYPEFEVLALDRYWYVVRADTFTRIIRGHWVRPDGVSIGLDGDPLTDTGLDSIDPYAATNGDTILVTYRRDVQRVYARLLDDIDPCDIGVDDCDDNAACVPSGFAFSCECLDGYEGDGFTCQPDECALGSDDCDPEREVCVDEPDGFRCDCAPGYELDSGACVCTDDADGDDVCDADDNCVDIANASQGDSDSDGFGNVCDVCPDDADPGQADRDGDGTGDLCDACPGDPDKTQSGVCGCGTADTDTDTDGTPDCNDACADDPDKIERGVCGCGTADTDSDGDGTPDCNDPCSDDPDKIEGGICGCGTADTDTDDDGTPDCNDACPDDPDKTEEGTCGCGVADIDTDDDSTPDCNDGCPDDPTKTDEGVCGCGVSDTNRDGDAEPDCNDGCPDDPNKLMPGVCGCGEIDVDDDEDLVCDDIDACIGSDDREDEDGDEVPDACDVCPNESDPDQPDMDADDVGDLCDVCPAVSDPDQDDGDGDGIGDACDLCPDDAGTNATGCPDMTSDDDADVGMDDVGDDAGDVGDDVAEDVSVDTEPDADLDTDPLDDADMGGAADVDADADRDPDNDAGEDADERDADASDLDVDDVAVDTEEDTDAPTMDADTLPEDVDSDPSTDTPADDADATADVTPPGGGTGEGCGCASTSTPTAPFGALVVGLGLALVRRRVRSGGR